MEKLQYSELLFIEITNKTLNYSYRFKPKMIHILKCELIQSYEFLQWAFVAFRNPNGFQTLCRYSLQTWIIESGSIKLWLQLLCFIDTLLHWVAAALNVSSKAAQITVLCLLWCIDSSSQHSKQLSCFPVKEIPLSKYFTGTPSALKGWEVEEIQTKTWYHLVTED